jgi:hypothetical protein
MILLIVILRVRRWRRGEYAAAGVLNVGCETEGAITVIEGWGSGGGIGIVGAVLIIMLVLYLFGGLRLSS